MNQNNTENLTSAVISWLRFPLTVLVILIHVESNLFCPDGESTGNLFDVIVSTCSHIVPIIAVPTFFLFSGYLYFYSVKIWDMDLYMTKTKKRIKSIMIPYIAWIFIAVIVSVSMQLRNGGGDLVTLMIPYATWRIFWDFNMTEGTTWFMGLLPSKGMTYPLIWPFWYVRNLMVLSLLTPAIHYMVNLCGKWFIAVIFLAYITDIWIQWPPLRIDGVFYFCLGCYLSIKGKELSDCFDRIKRPSYILALVATVFFVCNEIFMKIPNINAFRPLCLVLPGVISVICLTSHLMHRGMLKTKPLLTQSSFFIFSLHTICVIHYCGVLSNAIIVRCFPMCPQLVSIIAYVLTVIMTIGVCLSCYLTIKKICPKLLILLTGSRG